MRRLFRILTKLSLCLATAFSAVSCLEEDRDLVCSGTATLRIVYELNMSYTDQLRQQVDDLDLYIYNADGQLTGTRRITLADLDAQNRLQLEFTPGHYKIVFWGNCSSEYTLAGVDVSSQMRMRLACNQAGEVNLCTSLFHGTTEFEISSGNIDKTVYLTKDTNDIHVIIEDVDGVRNSMFAVGLTGRNGIYKQDNSLADENSSYPLTYMPTYCTSSQNEMQADFAIMRLLEDHSDGLRLTVSDLLLPAATATIIDFMLTQKILDINPSINTQEDLDRRDDYTIRLRIAENGHGWVLVSIKINDWEEIVNPGGV